MSCHLYCALRALKPPPRMPAGIGGRPVSLVCHQGLGLAVSRVDAGNGYQDLAAIRAHEQVVACLNRSQTVIPLRYGCRLADETQVARLLRDQAGHYEDLLRELDGCVEMGIRALWVKEATGAPEPEARPAADAGPRPGRPGWDYLQARRCHYERLEDRSREYERLARELAAAFSGLCARVKEEGPRPLVPLLSLYFLVPRKAVAAFRRRFRLLSRRSPTLLLLSGPWPPYNFVAAGDAGLLDRLQLLCGLRSLPSG